MTLQRCTACGAFQYPPREVCATCLSDRLDGDPSADTHGEVLARTLLHHSFEPRFRAQLPIAVGLVRFDAGPVAVCFLGPATEPGCRVQIRGRLDEMGHRVLEASS